jgi:hypothetical protein
MNNEPLKKHTVKTMLQDWKDNLLKQGKKAFWPSWVAGTYISDKNRKAKLNLQRLKDRVWPDVKDKVVRRHGKNVIVKYDRKMKTKKDFYFTDDNSLNAITRMLLAGGTRRMRRDLCRRLGLRWKTEYIEAEKMVMESDSFSGFGFDGIKASRGVK